ncbi:Glycoside hydrolase, family 10 [Corchorus olitorius]|uniref:Glycoside hydrolase, family 10 n=1 Tax=Corchorus olitorius TaxID=93759 RepID=A0A1R3GZ27_9ROSI|nr:Glycoside hydrolase, family 10 [Corchorus olitorius]
MELRKKQSLLLMLQLWMVFAGLIKVKALSYDYTASIECLAQPHKPQYGGGIIRNPAFDGGLKGWSTFGNATMELRELNGNRFIAAHSRNQFYDSVSHKFFLENNELYTFSAWIQVSEGSAGVRAVFKTVTGFKLAGAIVAESGCWSMLKGGLTVDVSGPAQLYFESHNTSIEIWVDSVSLQPFTQQEWRSHQVESIEKTKKMVRIQAMDAQGNPIANSKFSIEQKASGKPVGCATNKNILNNNAYQNWFTSRFTHTTFEDEMKWYSNEPTQGKEDYSVADSMMQLMKQNNIFVRGHNVFWNDPKYQPSWVLSLQPKDLSTAANKRMNSIMSKYKGQVIGWDVVNENLHFDFLESKLGPNASANFYKMANDIDPSVSLFMNDYNTLEESGDPASTPAKYLEKLKSAQTLLGANGDKMAIGLESHFSVPNLPYIRSSLDTLAAAKLPIWLTEVDVKSNPNQAMYLEQVLREGHDHPGVAGIIIWSAWKPEGCYRMCLTDNNFKNLATGDVVDKLLKEWGIKATVQGKIDSHGFFEASLFHGEYEVKITQSAALNSSLSHTFMVEPTLASVINETMILRIST